MTTQISHFIDGQRTAGQSKRTADVIPLCHPLPLNYIDVDVIPKRDGFEIEARVRTDARTGAEMEALHAVAIAALTVYDMVKAADKAMTIGDIRVVRKIGGKGGHYARKR
jgi:cyclic pyranopterin phosphate synthase